MFEIGWSELLVVGCLALIVVGPRDLPKLARSVGQYVNQMRGMAREFQRSMEEAAREADISQIKEIKQAASDLRSLNTMNLESIGRTMMAPTPATPAPATPTTAAPTPVTPATAAPAPAMVAPAAVATASTAVAAPAPPAARPNGEA